MWTIEKKFSFCYGHRVWNQTLDMGLSITPECKCRHLHGHEGEVTVCLSSAALTDGMVTDFKHLNWFKQWLDNVLDHKFIIDAIDPLYDVIIQGRPSLDKMPEGHFIPVVPKGSLVETHELLEGIVIVEFVPTSENLAKWLYDIVAKKLADMPLTVTSVTLCETPKSKAIYSRI